MPFVLLGLKILTFPSPPWGEGVRRTGEGPYFL